MGAIDRTTHRGAVNDGIGFFSPEARLDGVEVREFEYGAGQGNNFVLGHPLTGRADDFVADQAGGAGHPDLCHGSEFEELANAAARVVQPDALAARTDVDGDVIENLVDHGGGGAGGQWRLTTFCVTS